MNNKKNLGIVALALVAVIGIAGIAYATLGGGHTSTGPSLSNAGTAQSTQGTSAEASASAENTNAGSASAENASANGANTNSTNANGAGTESPQAATSADTNSTDQASDDSAGSETMKFNDFHFSTLEGEDVAISSFYGKPTLLGFWATWCPPCNAEAPEIQKLYERYGDRVNFVMLDAASDGRDTAEGTKEWLAQNNYSYPVYIDITGEAAGETKVYYLPTMYVLDKEGTVLTSFSGALDETSGAQLIEQLLAL